MLIVGIYRICADYVRRLSSCLLTFARPVETGTSPSKMHCTNALLVEMGGIEPPSRTPLACRNYNHASIMGAGLPFIKTRVEFNQQHPARRFTATLFSVRLLTVIFGDNQSVDRWLRSISQSTSRHTSRHAIEHSPHTGSNRAGRPLLLNDVCRRHENRLHQLGTSCQGSTCVDPGQQEN